MIYSILVDDNSEHEKANGVNKDYLLNNKCFNRLINSIQSQDHGTETYEIIKISLSCFDDKSKTMNIMN